MLLGGGRFLGGAGVAFPDTMLNFSTLRVLVNFLNPSQDFFGGDNDHLVLVRWAEAVRDFSKLDAAGDTHTRKPSAAFERSSLAHEISRERRMVFPFPARVMSKQFTISTSYTGARAIKPPLSPVVPTLRLTPDNLWGERLYQTCQPFRHFVWENYMDFSGYCLRELALVCCNEVKLSPWKEFPVDSTGDAQFTSKPAGVREDFFRRGGGRISLQEGWGMSSGGQES